MQINQPQGFSLAAVPLSSESSESTRIHENTRPNSYQKRTLPYNTLSNRKWAHIKKARVRVLSFLTLRKYVIVSNNHSSFLYEYFLRLVHQDTIPRNMHAAQRRWFVPINTRPVPNHARVRIHDHAREYPVTAHHSLPILIPCHTTADMIWISALSLQV